VLHRDIKPANALLTPAFAEFISLPNYVQNQKIPDQPLIKLADFGLAKIFNETSHLTKSDVVVGTPAYLSPEQVSSEKKTLTPASDIYSLGVVLYESLIGHPPFNSHALNITMAMIESMSPVSPRINRPEIPRDLETICLKCLEKEPEKRYRSALELAEDLDRFLTSHPIVARPLNKFQQFYRWCHRNRSTAAASFTAIISLVFLATGSFFYARNQARLRQIAENETNRALQAEAMARKESDLSRNNLFAGYNSISTIVKKLTEFEKNRPSNEDIAKLRINSLNLLNSSLDHFIKRLLMDPNPTAQRLDQIFRDAISIRDFGERAKAMIILQWILKIAEDCPSNHPAYLNRIVVGTRSSTISAMMLEQDGRIDEAVSIAENAWKSWPIYTDMPGIDGNMLYDRIMLGEQYLGLLQKKGRQFEALAVQSEVKRLIADRTALITQKNQQIDFLSKPPKK
jgi:tetratricopeptide (TPR) repeat protein